MSLRRSDDLDAEDAQGAEVHSESGHVDDRVEVVQLTAADEHRRLRLLESLEPQRTGFAGDAH
eukprot:14446812-Heterocapsa_arctica.AAC.1